jgi:hypothetical protein
VNTSTREYRHLLVVGLLGLLLAGLYFVAIDLQARAFIYSQQQNVIGGTAGSPYRYRVLVPLLLEAGTRAFSGITSREVAFLQASLVYDCVGFTLQLCALYALLRQFFSSAHAFVGLTFTSGVTVLTLSYFTYQPWSIVEVALFALGFLLAHQGRWRWVSVTVVLASLNRETGVFLPLALLLASLEEIKPFNRSTLQRLLQRPETRWSLGLVIVSTAIFAGLRLVRGGAEAVDPLPFVLSRNLDRNNLIAAGLAIPLVLGIGWFFALRGLMFAPPFLRRLARVVPLYLAAFLIWGWWREVRILTTLYAVLVPLIVAYCYCPRVQRVVFLRGVREVDTLARAES